MPLTVASVVTTLTSVDPNDTTQFEVASSNQQVLLPYGVRGISMSVNRPEDDLRVNDFFVQKVTVIIQGQAHTLHLNW